jgi:hypothetical protein
MSRLSVSSPGERCYTPPVAAAPGGRVRMPQPPISAA